MMSTVWSSTINVYCPPNRRVLVSDGTIWCAAQKQKSGKWQTDIKLNVIYWAEIQLPPKPPYLAPDNATIIPLQGRSPDILEMVMPGDEVWATEISALSNGKQSFLTIEEVLGMAAVVKLTSINQSFIVDWFWMRTTLIRLGWQTCYIRRPFHES